MYICISVEASDPLYQALMQIGRFVNQPTFRSRMMEYELSLHSEHTPTHFRIAGRLDDIVPMLIALYIYSCSHNPHWTEIIADLERKIQETRAQLYYQMTGRTLEGTSANPA